MSNKNRIANSLYSFIHLNAKFLIAINEVFMFWTTPLDIKEMSGARC